ncbi:hypothetical protein, partial [Burkholderia pseudomallei]|uniref:hypothetical protein n=1 Tax=Burkholderia pseudomallei TaxID=28450 RepID=UPI001C3E355A
RSRFGGAMPRSSTRARAAGMRSSGGPTWCGRRRESRELSREKSRKSAAKVPQNERPGEGRGAARFFLCAFRDEAARPFDSRRARLRAPRLAVCRAIAIQCGAGA